MKEEDDIEEFLPVPDLPEPPTRRAYPPIWRYAIPEASMAMAFFDPEELTPMSGLQRTIDIDLTIVNTERDLDLMVTRSYQKHGKKPVGIQLGWKAFLTLCAQRQDFGPQSFDGIPIVVHDLIHPMGRSLLAPATGAGALLKHLVGEDAQL